MGTDLALERFVLLCDARELSRQAISVFLEFVVLEDRLFQNGLQLVVDSQRGRFICVLPSKHHAEQTTPFLLLLSRLFGSGAAEVETEEVVLDDGGLAVIVLGELVDLGDEGFDLLGQLKVPL